MKTFNTDANNDIYLNTLGNISVATELAALLDVCEKAVKTTLGELVLQGDQGLPAFQVIWSGAPNIAQAESAIRNILLSVTGVLDVTELSAFVQNNVFSYSATIKTIYGEGVVSGV